MFEEDEDNGDLDGMDLLAIFLAPELAEPRLIWDRKNLLVDYSESEFRRLHRMSKRGFMDFLAIIDEDLEHGPTERGLPLTPGQQLTVTLTYLAGGKYKYVLALFIFFFLTRLTPLSKSF